MLQLRWPRPPRQRVQVTTPAQEVPFLPEHRPHGCQLPNESTTVLAGFSGKTVPIERRRGAQPYGAASRDLRLSRDWATLTPGEAQRPIKLLWWRDGTHGSPSTCWSCFWNYLRSQRKVRIIITDEECCWSLFFLFFSWCSNTLRETAVLLHSGRFLHVKITAVARGFYDCSEQCHITGYLDEFLL